MPLNSNLVVNRIDLGTSDMPIGLRYNDADSAAIIIGPGTLENPTKIVLFENVQRTTFFGEVNLRNTTLVFPEGCIGTNEIANGAITQDKIDESVLIPSPPGSVSTGDIIDQSITTNLIADFAVTTEKIEQYAVTTEKIANLAVTTEKLANLSVTTEKRVKSWRITSILKPSESKTSPSTTSRSQEKQPPRPSGRVTTQRTLRRRRG